MLDSFDIVDIKGNIAQNLHYAMLFEGELLLGFRTKEAADMFEQNMPNKNRYIRISDLKVSILIK